MSNIARMVMSRLYRKADGQAERLPWHQEKPPRLLTAAVAARPARGTALDLGCGAGVFSIWLAKQGFAVTAIDLFPEAIEMARARATQQGVQVDFRTIDFFEFKPDSQFDLVVDSGCLHSLIGGGVPEYKQQLLKVLAPGGDYVLGHWGKRHSFDWRPIGPRRRSEATINGLFEPELALRETDVTKIAAAIPFGPKIRGVEYWFRRRWKSRQGL